MLFLLVGEVSQSIETHDTNLRIEFDLYFSVAESRYDGHRLSVGVRRHLTTSTKRQKLTVCFKSLWRVGISELITSNVFWIENISA